ncbi:class I SAM-dependent methyltransferase [Rhodovulum marinum]|nr:class I SAM-dependent methyltransferase [Rhodovulum marinum]
MHPTEPLDDLARFSFEHAGNLCEKEHGCLAYHRAWSVIRLLLRNGAVPAGTDFFAEGLARAAVDGRCRVLLSGAADSGLAAMVLGALARCGLSGELVLAERCATPIEQNRRLAAHLGRGIELHHGNILDLDCAAVDAVVAHSFLNFLPAELRPDLVATWARVLRPGGLLLLHQKLGDLVWHLDAAALQANRQRLEAAALARGYRPETVQAIGTAGHAFWTRPRVTPSTRDSELREMLARSGLECLSVNGLDRLSVQSPSYVPGISPEIRQSLIVARRPL